MITRYTLNPFSELRRLQRDMNRLFCDYGSPNDGGFPAINLWAKSDEAFVTAEVSGINPEDLDINVNGSQLIVEGERKTENLEDATYHRTERGYGKFTRSIKLPFDVDNEKITANYKNGVLKITLPRAESSKPKKIHVTS